MPGTSRTGSPSPASRLRTGQSSRASCATAAQPSEAPRRRGNLEHLIQVAAVRRASILADNGYPALRLLFAVPNGGKRSIKTALDLKAEGTKPGVPDLFLPVLRPRLTPLGDSSQWPGLWIETKTPTGRLSDDQKQWRQDLVAQGYAYCVARSEDEIIDALLAYVRGTWQQPLHEASA